MKKLLELTVKGRKIAAVDASAEADLKKGEVASILDLRRAAELEEDLGAFFKEKDTDYLRIPMIPETVSEQDLDSIRWEFARNRDSYALISTGGTRAAAVLLMHAGRTEKWDYQETLKHYPDLKKEKGLASWVEAYLERHRTAD